MVVVTDAKVRIVVIRCVAIHVVDRGARAAVQNVVFLFEAQIVAPSAAPNAVRIVVQGVARDVAPRFAAIRFAAIRSVVDQRVANQDAMVVLPNAVPPNGAPPNDAQGVSPAGRQTRGAVRNEVVPDASPFAVPAPV